MSENPRTDNPNAFDGPEPARSEGPSVSPFTRLLPVGLRRLRFSRLTARILAINIFVLFIPVFGLFWADQYYDNLVEAELQTLRTEGKIIAVTVASATVFTNASGQEQLVPARAARLLQLLSAESSTRVRLFRPDGQLIADSNALGTRTGVIEVQPAPGAPARQLQDFRSWWQRLFAPGGRNLPLYSESRDQLGDHYSEVRSAFFGTQAETLRQNLNGDLVLSVALPVTRYRQVLGALMLSRDNTAIDQAVRDIRVTILQVFIIALAVTVLLSLYLSGSIVRPVIDLASAADRVRYGKAHQVIIPDFSDRRDEIGDLSLALREMTEALWLRIDAIEAFAADVSHEIKNPLTSIKSAIETAELIDNPDNKKKLINVAIADINRLDRLITDISDASRLDAELSRGQNENVNLMTLLTALTESHNLTHADSQIVLSGTGGEGGVLPSQVPVLGIEGRLGQVFRNLISNALSFSPDDAPIRLILSFPKAGWVKVDVEDQGPGMPPEKVGDVFNRFYTDRPQNSFGSHSGLGLSISKQIAQAHGGDLRAENIIGEDGQVCGARFTFMLPLAKVKV